LEVSRTEKQDFSARAEMAQDAEEWLPASAALALLEPTMGRYTATMTICARAHDGLIRARAKRFIRGSARAADDVEIPAAFWWARGHGALKQNWKAGDFETWIDQRTHLKAYGVSFLRSQIEEIIPHKSLPPFPAREPTGWERVDRTLETAHTQLFEGRHEEDYQAVGLHCREIIISLGQAVYDPAIHKSRDGVVPSEADGGRMIEAFLATAASGGSNEDIRRHARAALNLALHLQHKRTADFRAAALCLEATSSLANILAILIGRRDPPGGSWL
jgi:hypothetical protein